MAFAFSIIYIHKLNQRCSGQARHAALVPTQDISGCPAGSVTPAWQTDAKAGSLFWDVWFWGVPPPNSRHTSGGSCCPWRGPAGSYTETSLQACAPKPAPFSPQLVAKGQVMTVFSGVFAGGGLWGGNPAICPGARSVSQSCPTIVGSCQAVPWPLPVFVTAITIIAIVIFTAALWSTYYQCLLTARITET